MERARAASGGAEIEGMVMVRSFCNNILIPTFVVVLLMWTPRSSHFPLKLLAVSVGLLFASFCFGFAFDS